MTCRARFKARADTRVVDEVTILPLRDSFSTRFIPSVVVTSIKLMDVACLFVVLLLASASLARRRLLEQAQIDHQVMVS